MSGAGTRAERPATRPASRADALAAAGAGCLAAAAFAQFGLGARGAITAFFCVVLVVLARIDLERRVVPDRIVLPAAALVAVAQLAAAPDRWVEWLVAPVAAFALLLLPLLVRPSGIGFGDVKLMLLLGAALGFGFLDALLVGFLLVVPVGLFLLAREGANARSRAIPLAPFLAAGAVLITFLA